MTNLQINLTQSDIDNGERFNCARCPGALAINKWLSVAQIPWYAEVYADEIWFYKNIEEDSQGRVYSPLLPISFARSVSPQKLQTFVRRFDEYLPVHPTSFQLELPEEVTA